MTKVLFLPGAGGSAQFWKPVANKLSLRCEMHFFSWPGLGDEPHAPGVEALEDLVNIVLAEMSQPVDLLAQSMGGLVALAAALAAPNRVRRIVLTGTSGGVPVAEFGGADWRDAYRAEFPDAKAWITEAKVDFSSEIPRITAPALLLWGDEDLISPLPVGRRLRDLLPNASLHVVKGGGHEFVRTHSQKVAALIEKHLL